MPQRDRRRRGGRVSFATERKRMAAGTAVIVGIDEAGMGPWAGPLVAAAVRLDPSAIPKGLGDSKILTRAKREACFDDLMRMAAVGVGIADVDRIDRDNVLAASHWAMAEAVSALGLAVDLALIDGRHAANVGCPCEAIIDGDAKIASIAAASIIAKVTRDRIMTSAALEHPDYGFEKHKGYGTAEHRAAITRLGLCPLHRRSYRPIAAFLAGESDWGLRPLTHEAGDPE